MTKTRDTKINELLPDQHNANKGTERGRYMLEESLRKYGAGRSILVDKHGRVIAGNKTLELAGSIGLDDVIMVPTDGTKIVAVQRTDLDLDTDPRARELAYADNRVSEVDLAFDAEVLAADLNAGIDLSTFWRDEEIDDAIAQEEFWSAFNDAESGGGGGKGERKLDEKAHAVKAVIITDDIATVESAIRETGEQNRGKALVLICEAFLHEKR